jgi:hypothetical protein
MRMLLVLVVMPLMHVLAHPTLKLYSLCFFLVEKENGQRYIAPPLQKVVHHDFDVRLKAAAILPVRASLSRLPLTL